MPKTLLAMGAHYDDCVFGIPGIMLQAIRKNYRVVILSMIGDYKNWQPVLGREQELVDGAQRISRDFGAEMVFLDFASMRYDVTEENKRKVAEVVAAVEPDVAFMLWPHDSHADHEVASQLSKIALRHGDRLLGKRQFKRPRRIYWYDNGPRHTVGFEPNTFVDVSDDWQQAMNWLGQLMALVRNEPYDAEKRDGAQLAKQSLADYRGRTCGAKYAEAIRACNAYPQEIL